MELISGEIKQKDTEPLKDTPFKDKGEGNKFREWIHKKDEKYAKEIGLKKDSDQYNNEIIKKAWKKYGEEYQKDKK